MADHHALQYWLESINLTQYYPGFIEHGISTQEQCQQLDEDTLEKIGVSLEGHKRRIMTHLPSAELWEELSSAEVPNLPPKTKSVRDSFLYENLPSLPLSSQGLTLDLSKSGPQASGSSDIVSGSVEKPKPTPRPVPKPRPRKAASPAATPTTPNPPTDEKPIPARRPTPAPRRTASPKIDLSQPPTPTNPDSKSWDISNDKSDDSATDMEKEMPESHSKASADDVNHDVNTVLFVDSSSSESLSKASPISSGSIKISGVCIDASSTDDDSNVSELYALPDKKNKVLIAQSTRCVPETKSPNNISKINEKTTDALISDDIYENLGEMHDGSGEYVSDIPKKPVEDTDDSKNSMAICLEQEEFVNADYDPTSNTFVPKPEESTSDDKRIDSESHENELYEAIWKSEGNNSSASYRSSSLMQFPPSPNGHVDLREKDLNEKLSQRVSKMSLFRDSASFDLPPPLFAPPPLPASAITDVIADFDPLTQNTATDFPQLPPRPKNYTPPKFENYVNIQYTERVVSATLPDSEGTMEPELPLYPAQSISQNDGMKLGTDDPFSKEDPFGQFQPDYEDFDQETGAFPPNSCHGNTTDDSFVHVGKDFSGSKRDEIYSFASSETVDFDPFGLKRQASELSAGSTGSNESRFRLSEVPPAPKNFHTLPGQEATYSYAENINDADSSSNGSLDDLIDGDRGHTGEDSPGTMAQVEILPATSLSPRRRERSGYLYKQGGVRQNRGWRKRWVIFDGKSLRYYSSSKDQVSKRIVPLSCMINVEIDVKHHITHLTANSKQYKFKLHCTNRVFLFAADNLDDCKMWSNTLMEAIITYTPPPGGEVPGEDMADPDMDGWIKINRNRYKFYVVLKKHKLCYYQNEDDFKMASPLHEIDMKLSSVKEVDRTKLQLNTHYSTFLLNFESSSDASNWKMAIEEAITDAIGDNNILDQVLENPANAKCADCGASDAHWASMNLSVVLCLRCAGIHRSFDLRLSKVRSLRMDTRVWNSSLIEMFKVIGNDNANNFWLKNLAPGTSINRDTPSEDRKQHIQHKYRDRKYCDIHQYASNKQLLNEALLEAAQTDDVLLTYQILLSGADVMYHRPGQPDATAFELAKQAHQRIQMEFLLQNGGDKTKNFMPGSEEASLVAKLRAEVQVNGYLHKTGSNMKAKNGDFLKRWCVLEHGHLSYYVSEESKVEKDRIDNECILFIQAIHNDKFPSSFEISTKKNNRIYLFGASSEDERSKWMQSISRVFCPVALMDQVRAMQFSLAGYTYMKTGFTSEWQRTWIMLENRKLIFIDKEETEREQDSVDLRKVTSIAKVSQSQAPCEACLEPQGVRFVMKAQDRILYFQADLARDTERLFNAMEIASKRGGDRLEDQPLTNEDVPVIVATCIDFIQQHGLKTTGLYRKAEQETKIKGLLQKFHEDARNVVLRIGEETVDLVCNVLKRFLRSLSDPLLTKQLYNRWLVTADESDHNVKLQWYKYLLQQLPRINYLTLKALAAHLSKLSTYADENLMTLSNISIAFGPTLMNTDNSTSLNTETVGNSMQLEMKVIEEIVLYHVWLFDIKEDRKASVVEDKIIEAQKRIEEIGGQQTTMKNDLMVFVYMNSPKGNAESIMVKQETTVSEVISQITTKHKISTPMALYEIIKEELERPLCPNMKVWSVVTQWQNWSSYYAAGACLCLKTNELQSQIEKSYIPGKPLFCELKFSDTKKKFSKVVLEFAQAKLSYYKDTKV